MNRCLSLGFITLIAISSGGCALTKPTQYSQIYIQLQVNGESSTAPGYFSTLEEVMNDWAKESGFKRAAGHDRLFWSPTATDGDERVVYYEENPPTDANWPIEVMVACDPNDYPLRLYVMTSAGRSRRCGERMEAIHADLLERLSAEFGEENVQGSIW